MNKSASHLESDLRVSPKPVIAVLIVYGAVVFFSSVIPTDLAGRARITLSALLLFALSAIAWLLDNWKPWASRWMTVLMLTVVIFLASGWLGAPGSLMLATIPVALAAALINLPAAGITAVVGTALALFLPALTGTNVDLATMVTAVVSVWTTFIVMCFVYRPVYQVARWVWGYYQEARTFLEEARDRKEELEQALEGLAHANRQLALSNERMAMLRRSAEEAQKAKTAFVAKVSHEFRTPLNMITGLVDIMTEAPELYAVTLSPKMREDLEVVHRNCEHLSNMINDVLDLTRVEAGRLALHREHVDLHEIVQRTVEIVQPLLEKKQLALQITIPQDLPEIYCDRVRIQQVLLNLVSNAARFTEEGRITIETVRQEQHIVVSVTDTGPGISQDDAKRIFEPFSQGASELWRDKGGSGLGLSISRQFVKLHGGRMWLESQLGIGSSFFFTLPISPPVEHVVRPGHQLRRDWIWRERAFKLARPGNADEMAKPRVVVCDETGGLYPELARCSDEIELVEARGLAEAERDLQECPAHALILNTADPDDLWPLAEAAKQRAPATPIIGCSVSRMVERAIEAGALGHLIKPVTRADLEKAIQAPDKPVRRVLVVDDDPDVLQLFARMLRICDSTLEVVTASSGEQALSMLRRASPDLMLLDIVMPGMDGWQVLEAMEQDEEIEDVPTFFVSAQDPADQPPVSHFMLATMDGGFSLGKLLTCSLEMSTLLLEPEEELDLGPV